MAKYIAKPVVIEAFRFSVLNNWPDWFTEAIDKGIVVLQIDLRNGNIRRASIRTLEGIMTVELGDFVVKGIHDELYPCKYDIFIEKYEPVNRVI